MKTQSALRLFLFSALSCTCYGAALQFPTPVGFNNDPLDGTWTQTDSIGVGAGTAGVDTPAWVSITTGAVTLKGVSLGAAYNDYADVTDGTFSVSHSTATVGVANGGLDGNWGFQVNAATDFPPNDNFSISLLEGGGANILTINLDYAGANLWALSVNGNALVGAGGAQGFVEAGGFYRLYANFGATTGFGVNVVALDGSIIQFNGTTADFSAKDFGRVAIGESNGLGGGSFGNSFITVVPEPSSAMLLSLIPGFFILRRRR